MGDQAECLPLINDEDIINNCGPVEIPPPPAHVQALDESGPRLMIYQIVAENFKSYGGKRIMGPFHKNFTCVIGKLVFLNNLDFAGPNGSGKSNVIDSLLFVFGYRASKVRSKKVSQLIHKSELIPNPKSCLVAVHFQKIIDIPNSPDYEVVPNSHMVVSRRAFQDNSSSYYIDDSRVVYRDVANLLRCHGIDLDHNRFLILQGEVEQIALMKPKAPTEHEDGFLEYLEDIIGSSRFKKPLAIFDNRIERLSDLRLEKVARVKAVEKEKDELEGVRNEAVGYFQLLNKLIHFKNILYQQNLIKERAVVKETREKLEEAQVEVQTRVSGIQEKSRELTQAEVERDDLIRQLGAFQTSHRDTKAKFSLFEAEDGRLRDEHAHTKAAGRRLMKAIQTEQKKLEELNKLPDEAEDRRESIKRQLDELEETRKKHEEAYKETVNNLELETAPLRLQVEGAEAVLAPLQLAADEANSKLTLEREQFELQMTGQRRERDRADRARSGIDQARTALADRKCEMDEAQKQLEGSGKRGSLESALTKANRDMSDAKAREAELIKLQSALRSKVAELKSNLQADNSRSRVLSALLEAKRANKLSGIMGRLGDLGAIPSKYDVAISTACGPLDNIVTDTMDSAQKAVTFLKQNNLGQATFIALDKMSKWSSQASQSFQLPQTSFEVERLYDLVRTVDPQIKAAFYYALRDTLVTKNLDMATKIAFGGQSKQGRRYRVVTLEGQLIETSGAMSGGGSRPLAGRMLFDLQKVHKNQQAFDIPSDNDAKAAAQSSNNLSELEKQLIQYNTELAQVRELRFRHEEIVQRMTRTLNESQATVKRCKVECERLHAQIHALTGEAEQADKRAKTLGPSAAVCQKMENELKKLEKLAADKSATALAKKAATDKLKAQLLDVGSARITAVRSRLDAIEKKTKETNDQLTKLEVSVKTAARNRQKSDAKLKSLEAELEAERTKLVDVDAKLKQVEEDARLCMVDFQGIKTKMEELQSVKDTNQVKLTTIESELAGLRKAEAVCRHHVEQLEVHLKQTSTRIRHLERELRGLQLHEIDDDDDLAVGDESSKVESDDCSTTTGVHDESDQNGMAGPKPSKIRRKEKSLELPTYTSEQLQDMTVDQSEMQKLENRLDSMAPNMTAIEEYRRKTEVYLTRVGELKHITNLLGEQRKQREDAKMKRLTEFLNGFHAITNKLKEMYQMITQGGDAELELIDSLDPFSEGIVFSVRPPKKSWKNISNLSGGEKTLSSLALVFALHHYRPTPLYVMDEIDAALDFKNVSIVGNYLKERTRNAQFLVISLRSNMFELSDRLVGIYKTHNITKTVTVDPSTLTDQLERLIVRVAATCGRQVEARQLLAQHPPNQRRIAQPLSQQTAVDDLPLAVQCEDDGMAESDVVMNGQVIHSPVI